MAWDLLLSDRYILGEICEELHARGFRIVDGQVAEMMREIQVDPEWMSVIREAYTHEIAEKLGHLCSSEQQELEAALKAVDEEEARATRLYAAGEITDQVWNALWEEWLDKRRTIQSSLASLNRQNKAHIADEEEELLSELAVLEALQLDPGHISQISYEALEGWICDMRDALESEDKALARCIIQQFVAKIVIKEGTGTCNRAFPFPDDSYMRGFRDLDLGVSGTLTRHILQFDIPLPALTESDLRNPDKEQLRADILAMRQQGMSYRQVACKVGLHWTRVQQIVKSSE